MKTDKRYTRKSALFAPQTRKDVKSRRSEPSVGTGKSPDETLFELLMRDPEKKALVIKILENNKDEIEQYKKKEERKNKHIRNAQRLLHCESPTALHRRRVLQQGRCSSDSSSTGSSNSVSVRASPVPFDKLLKGVVAYVEICSKGQDRSAGAKALLQTLGATVRDQFTVGVTHVIFKDGSYNTYTKAKLTKVHLVSVLWLEAVRKNNCRVFEKDYPALGVENLEADLSMIYQDYENIVHEEYNRSLAAGMNTPSISNNIKGRKAALPSELQAVWMSDADQLNVNPVRRLTDIIPTSQAWEAESVISYDSGTLPYRKVAGKEQDDRSDILSNSDAELTSDDDSERAVINGHSFSRPDSLLSLLDCSLDFQQKNEPETQLSSPSASLLARKSTRAGNCDIVKTVDMDLTEPLADNKKENCSVGTNQKSANKKKIKPTCSSKKENSDKRVTHSKSLGTDRILRETCSNSNTKPKKAFQKKSPSLRSKSELFNTKQTSKQSSLSSEGLRFSLRISTSSNDVTKEIIVAEKSKTDNSATEKRRLRSSSQTPDVILKKSPIAKRSLNKIISEDNQIQNKPAGHDDSTNIVTNEINVTEESKKDDSSVDKKRLRSSSRTSNVIVKETLAPKSSLDKTISLSNEIQNKQAADDIGSSEISNEIDMVEQSTGKKRLHSGTQMLNKNYKENCSAKKSLNKIVSAGNQVQNKQAGDNDDSRFSLRISSEHSNSLCDIDKNLPSRRSSERLATRNKNESLEQQSNFTTCQQTNDSAGTNNRDENEDDTTASLDKILAVSKSEENSKTLQFPVAAKHSLSNTKTATKNINPKSPEMDRKRPTLERLSQTSVKPKKFRKLYNLNQSVDETLREWDWNDVESVRPAPIRTAPVANLTFENFFTKTISKHFAPITITQSARKLFENQENKLPENKKQETKKKEDSSKPSSENQEKKSPKNKKQQKAKKKEEPAKRSKKVELETSRDEQKELMKEYAHSSKEKAKKRKHEDESDDDNKTRRKSQRLSQIHKEGKPTAESDRRSTLEFVKLKQARKVLMHKRHRKKSSIVCTRFHKSEVITFMQIVRKLRGFFVEDEVSEKTTHLVVGETKRTINLLRAIARGCWVVNQEWLYRSLEAEKWLPEEDFELTEFSEAIQQCRKQRQAFKSLYSMDIFAGCGPMYVSYNSIPSQSDLQELIELCKGTLTNVPYNASIVVGEWVRYENVTCVSEKWVLDSITENKRKSFKKYLLKQSN